MKAASRFLSAAFALTLPLVLVLSGGVALQLASASVAQAATVSSIEVRGNQRVDDATVRNYIGIKPGVPFNRADVNDALKRLFATGLFRDVKINQVGGTLVVTVDEYPIVNQVLFQGNKKIKDKSLARAVQLQPRGPVSDAMMEADAKAIRQAYGNIGRNDAQVSYRTQDLGDNRVNVIFDIQEGGRTKIASVDFVGNKAFSDGRLRDLVSTKRSNIFSVLFRNDIYDENRLRADEEKLRRFYYNHGYADFRVVSSSADLNEAENEYHITITVDEGERYTFGDIGLETTIPGIDVDDLSSGIETHEGDVYSAEKVEDSIINLTEKAAGLGYAFAEVTPRGSRNFETRQISVVYSIDEGPRVYIQRIEIRGNTRTRDYVIRREFDVAEGDAFNKVLIQRAKKRLEELDFFRTVNISTVPGSQPDQVVLVVDVIEKPTGEFSIGAGYSTGASSTHGAGFTVEGSVTERNFMGRGQYIRVSAGGGKDSRDYQLSFTEPYFLGRRISAGFDIYHRTREYANYDRATSGATVRFGLPITEALSTQFAYNYQQDDYEYQAACDRNGDGIADNNTPWDSDGDGVNDANNTCTVSTAIQNAVEGQSPWVKSSVSASLIFNTIDNMKSPREGIYANFTTEVAGLGGDAKFVKVTGRASYYKTLSEEYDVVGLLSAGAGHVEAYSGTLRVFDQFESNTQFIRGFDYNGIGPYECVNAGCTRVDHLGGKSYFHATAEAQFPLPVVPRSLGVRGALFADAATLFGTDIANAQGTAMNWRASVGVGLLWDSPFGPLRVDYAIPVLKEPQDEVQNFNFGISTQF